MNIGGDLSKSENLLARRLSKLNIQICKILNIDIQSFKLSKSKSTFDIIENVVKISRRVQRVLKSTITSARVSSCSVKSLKQLAYVMNSQETIITRPVVDPPLDRKLE